LHLILESIIQPVPQSPDGINAELLISDPVSVNFQAGNASLVLFEGDESNPPIYGFEK
jgi:hypothetical protein